MSPTWWSTAAEGLNFTTDSRASVSGSVVCPFVLNVWFLLNRVGVRLW